jgi:hypothetical protein
MPRATCTQCNGIAWYTARRGDRLVDQRSDCCRAPMKGNKNYRQGSGTKGVKMEHCAICLGRRAPQSLKRPAREYREKYTFTRSLSDAVRGEDTRYTKAAGAPCCRSHEITHLEVCCNSWCGLQVPCGHANMFAYLTTHCGQCGHARQCCLTMAGRGDTRCG